MTIIFRGLLVIAKNTAQLDLTTNALTSVQCIVLVIRKGLLQYFRQSLVAIKIYWQFQYVQRLRKNISNIIQICCSGRPVNIRRKRHRKQ